LHVVVHDREHDSGLLASQPRERRGDERGERGREAAEAQPAGPPAGDLGQVLLGAVQAGVDHLSVADEYVAGLGQRARTRAALHEGQPDFAFQRGDVLAHRRLGQAQRVGRGRERSPRGDLAQHSDAAHVTY
jgi:hypothetical protein